MIVLSADGKEVLACGSRRTAGRVGPVGVEFVGFDGTSCVEDSEPDFVAAVDVIAGIFDFNCHMDSDPLPLSNYC